MEKNLVENSRNIMNNISKKNEECKMNSNYFNTKLLQFKNEISNKSHVIFLLANSICTIVLFVFVCFNLMETNRMKNEIHILKLNNSKVIRVLNKLSNEIEDIDFLSSNEYFKVFIFKIKS
jgi:hypothetical protein